jgi:CBS domain containing-hemolysin-like protein
MEAFWPVVLKFLAVALLVAANALFVAAEFALVSARPTKLRPAAERGDYLSRIALEAQKQINYYLSSCQVGITIASLGLGWIGEPAIAETLIGLFSQLESPWNWLATHTVAVAIAFSLIVLLHVILGELVPKALAILKPEPVARMAILPLIAFSRVGAPVIWLLNEAANAFVKLLGLTLPEEFERIHSPEELEILMRQSRVHGMLGRQPMKMIERVFDLSRTTVREVMTPRTEIISVEESGTFADLFHVFQEASHARFPIYRERPENIIGYVAIRDALKALSRDPHALEKPIQSLVRPILYVPENKTVSTLFAQMQRDRIPMVAVVDEFSDTVGIVTLDGLAEEIVGSLGDELAKPLFQQVDAHTLRVDGQLRVDDANEVLGLKVPEREEYQTIAGFILYQLKRVPQPGESLQGDHWKLTVDQMEGPRIEKVLIQKL